MTVGELMDILDGMDEDMEIRLAEQPSYPFAYSVECVSEYEGKAYLCEGRQICYLDRKVWDC